MLAELKKVGFQALIKRRCPTWTIGHKAPTYFSRDKTFCLVQETKTCFILTEQIQNCDKILNPWIENIYSKHEKCTGAPPLEI